MRSHEIAVFCGQDLDSCRGPILLDDIYPPFRLRDLDAPCRRLLGLPPAFQQYMLRLGHIRTQELAVFCGGYIRYKAGDMLLDRRLFHKRRTDSDALHSRQLSMAQASQ